MTNAQPTYGSGTVELEYDGPYLIGVKTQDSLYEVCGHVYKHTWFTNGKVKRMVSKYDKPIALYYFPSPNDHTPYLSGRNNEKAVEEWAFQSINSIISYYPIRSDLIEQMVLKMGP